MSGLYELEPNKCAHHLRNYAACMRAEWCVVPALGLWGWPSGGGQISVWALWRGTASLEEQCECMYVCVCMYVCLVYVCIMRVYVRMSRNPVSALMYVSCLHVSAPAPRFAKSHMSSNPEEVFLNQQTLYSGLFINLSFRETEGLNLPTLRLQWR